MAALKVLVVEDSDIIADVIAQTLENDKKIQVIGRASNGQEALEKLKTLTPDLITMDVWMPVMDGFETVERIMASKPTPILVITSSKLKEDVQLSMRMLAAGALDIMEKPSMRDESQWQHHQKELVSKVKMLAGVKVITHIKGRNFQTPVAAPMAPKPVVAPPPIAKPTPKASVYDTPRMPFVSPVPNYPPFPSEPIPPKMPLPKFPPTARYQVAALASSTGGPSALLKILQALPPNLPGSLMIVQHISEGFTQGLVDWLQRECALKVKIVQAGEIMLPGVAYFAPDRRDVLIDAAYRIVTKSESSSNLRPSGDVMMRSIASTYGKRAIGVVLTGMGNDGAVGLKAMREVGSYTITQDEATSLIYGMPKQAFEAAHPNQVLPIGSIAARLIELFQEPAEHSWNNKAREG